MRYGGEGGGGGGREGREIYLIDKRLGGRIVREGMGTHFP